MQKRVSEVACISIACFRTDGIRVYAFGACMRLRIWISSMHVFVGLHVFVCMHVLVCWCVSDVYGYVDACVIEEQKVNSRKGGGRIDQISQWQGLYGRGRAGLGACPEWPRDRLESKW